MDDVKCTCSNCEFWSNRVAELEEEAEYMRKEIIDLVLKKQHVIEWKDNLINEIMGLEDKIDMLEKEKNR